MTTATTPLPREILDERWRSGVTKPKRYQEPDGSRSTGLDNSADFYRWEETVVALATRLKGDGLDAKELDEVENIAASIWDETLRSRLVQWAAERVA